MNIQKENIYSPYDLALSVCKFVYPSVGERYELQWKNKLLPLFKSVFDKDDTFFILNEEFNEGDVIFADNFYMKDFYKHFSLIKTPFILVSAESDSTVPFCDVNDKCNTILDNPYLIKWFSVNIGMEHPKLSPIPIGIPKHLPFIENHYMGWFLNHNIKQTKNTLFHFMNYNDNDIRNNFLKDKKEFMYTRMTVENSEKNLHPYRSIRKNILCTLEKNGFEIKKKLIPVIVYYAELTNYKMCLSGFRLLSYMGMFIFRGSSYNLKDGRDGKSI